MVSVVKIVVLLLILSAFLVNSNIVINMDQDSLEQLGEMLIQNYIHNNLTPRTTFRKSMWGKTIKFIVCVLHLIGITTSLIAANIFTPFFQAINPKEYATQSTGLNIISNPSYKNTTFAPSDLCPHDFGCDRNLCWRTCHRGHKDEKLSWCYTTKPNSGKYSRCIEMPECSPCWECLGSCHHK